MINGRKSSKTTRIIYEELVKESKFSNHFHYSKKKYSRLKNTADRKLYWIQFNGCVLYTLNYVTEAFFK